MSKTITLFRPTGPKELALIKKSGWKKFPPRLPEQPFFYPVTSVEYARKIAKEWNVKASGAGYVLEFQVESDYLSNFQMQTVGGNEHQEYWIPAEKLEEFNAAIIGKILKIETYQDWFVYIVKCSDDTLYTGITNNLKKRIQVHNDGKGAKYTKTRRPVNLVNSFVCASKSEALKLEHRIKKLSREEKLKFTRT